MEAPKTSGKVQPVPRVSTGDNGARSGDVRVSFAERWFLALSAVCGLLCVLTVFRPFFQSHFDSILSDPGDGRLCLTILEHWVKVFHGQAPAASPNFIFPERGVLGHSDTFFLHALPYAALRFLGLDRYLAFQATMMLLTGAGFASMLGLIHLLQWFDPWLEIAGASLFTISNIYYAQIVHPQLAAVAFVPLLCVLSIEFWGASNRNLARVYAAAFGILLALILFTSFYIGWFAIFIGMTVLAFLIICSVLCARSQGSLRRGAQLLWMRKLDLLLGLGAFTLAMVPFFALYLPVLGRTRGRNWAEALYFMPGLPGGVDAGRDNLIWGWLARRIEGAWTPVGVHESPAGWPVLTVCVFLASALYFVGRLYRLRRNRNSREKQQVLWLSAISLASIALWLASIKLSGSVTAWAVVWRLVPGASAIRVPQRVGLVLNVGVVLVSMAGVSAFLKGQSGPRARIRLVAVLLPLALLAEQINSMPTHLISRLAEAQRFQKIPPPPKECSAFFITHEGGEAGFPVAAQTDAMLVARQFDIPTLNGYSGWPPRGWNLLQAVDDGGNAAIHWAQRRGVNRGLCELDFTQGRWFPVDPQEPRGLSALSSRMVSGLIRNPGFEDGGLSAWSTYRSVQIGLSSARAHTGTYSLMETAGEGSVYQDVTGLEPGRVYGIAAWAAGSCEATATAQIAVFDPGSDVATFSSSVSPDSVWQPVEHRVTAGPGGILRIHLYRNQGAGVIYWDDVTLYALE